MRVLGAAWHRAGPSTVKPEPIRVDVETFALEEANGALRRLKAGEINGAAVLIP
jgi:D-arabinose 1-dehydrogenase-like Zn-dependent alcohol dehydrogenase